MNEAPSEPARGHASSALRLLSASLLAACFFFPSVRACDTPIAPLDVPWAFPPHLFAALLVGVTIARRLWPARMRRLGAWILVVAGAVTTIFLQVLAVLSVVDARKHESVATLVVYLLWMLNTLPLVALQAETLLRRRGLAQAEPRFLWTTGLAMALWFAMWALVETPLWGLWLALTACLGLALSLWWSPNSVAD